MRAQATRQRRLQRHELGVLLHHHQAFADAADRGEVGGDDAAVVAAVEGLSLGVDDLSRDHAGGAGLRQRAHGLGRQRAAGDHVAVFIHGADGVEREIAFPDARELLADHRLLAQLRGELFGTEHQRRIEVEALGVEAARDLHGALIRPVGVGRAEIAAELHHGDVLQIRVSHHVGDGIDGAAPGDADMVAARHVLQEHRGRHLRHLRLVARRFRVRHHPGAGEAIGVFQFARQHVLGEQLRRGGDADNAGVARLAQIHRHRCARDVEPRGHLVLAKAVGVIEPRRLVNDLFRQPDRHEGRPPGFDISHGG